MSLAQEIMNAMGQDGVQKAAGILGTDQQQASNVLGTTVSTLVGGMAANSTSQGGASSLFEALGQHIGRSDAMQSINDGSSDEGNKIVQHVLGPQSDAAAQEIGKQNGIDMSAVTKLLPVVAPIVMSYLADRMKQGGQGAQDVAKDLQQDTAQAAQQNPGLGNMLGNLLGGGGGIGSMLGGILGGR